GEAQNALNGRRHVFMQPVRELDHDDRALARGSNEASRDGARNATELAKHDLHAAHGSTWPRRVEIAQHARPGRRRPDGLLVRAFGTRCPSRGSLVEKLPKKSKGG